MPSHELPLVSVITPFYNTGREFFETAASIAAQTLQNFEVLIVNDATTLAESQLFLQEGIAFLRNSGVAVRLIQNEQNKGLSATRNIGGKHAAGEMLFFLDSDDLIEPTCLEKSYWKLKTSPALAFVGAWTRGFGAQNYIWTKGFDAGPLFLKENLTSPLVLVRKSVFTDVCEKLGGFDETMRDGLEDWDFWLKCASLGHWGTTIPEVLNAYRRRDNHADRWAAFSEKGRKKFLEIIPTKYPNLNERNGEGFPKPARRQHSPNSPVCMDIPAPGGIWRPESGVHTNEPPMPRRSRNLLFIVPHFQMGGADKWNLDSLKLLVKNEGWAVTLVATNSAKNEWLGEFQNITKDIHILENFLTLPDYPRYLRYLIQARQPEIVLVSNSQLAYLLLPALRAYFPEIPFVDYVHMEEVEYRSGGYAMDSVRHIHSLAMTGVASAHLRGWMSARGKNPEKTSIVPINVDTQFWRRDAVRGGVEKAKLGIPERQSVILYACRFELQKQPDVFCQTVEAFFKKGGNATFLIAGGGSKIKLIQQLEKRHPKSVRFLGSQTPVEIRELLNFCDIAFLPSEMEGISLLFYEAMAMGVVPVGADVGGQTELVTPECGILLQRNPLHESKAVEAERYADCLLDLIAAPEKMTRMKEAARRRVEAHFSLEKMLQNMLALFGRAKHENARLPRIPVELAEDLAADAVENFRLFLLAEASWCSQATLTMNEQFRNSFISPKFSRTKRNILRFLMRRL
jgi:glycosyltransferase involved in cell wall biosynthesis